jgi:formylglycine-generating enzyme
VAFLAAAAVFYFYDRVQPVVSLPLGDKALCAAYSGLPLGWGNDPHAGMVYVPGGRFTLGTALGYPEERSEAQSSVQGFWIDRTEVTVAQFATFAAETGYLTEAEQEGGGVVFVQPNAEENAQRDYAWWRYVKGANWRQPQGEGSHSVANQPVTLVTLHDALAYAHWLGRDLPAETEWEFAAKAGRSGVELEHEPRAADGAPTANFWQGEFPLQNTQEDGFQGLAPVGCFAGNAFGVFDMIGNAWEQTKDVYTAAHVAGQVVTQVDHAGLQTPNTAMTVKGGSHLCGRNFCVRYRASAREAHEANLPLSHIGFRTVSRDAPSGWRSWLLGVAP